MGIVNLFQTPDDEIKCKIEEIRKLLDDEDERQ